MFTNTPESTGPKGQWVATLSRLQSDAMWVQLRDKLSTSCWILFDTDISFPGALRVFVCPKHESIRHSNASIPLAYYMHLVLTHSHIVCRMWSWVPRPGLPCQLLGCPYKLTVYDSIDPQYCVTISWIGKNSWANNVLFQCIQNVLASEAFFWYQHLFSIEIPRFT